MYRRCAQGAADHAAAASEGVLELSVVLLPAAREDLRTAGGQWAAFGGGQSCAGNAESRYLRAFPTGLTAAHQGASRSSKQPREPGRQTQMAGNKQTRPGGGGLGNKRSLQVDMRSSLGRRGTDCGQVKWWLSEEPFFSFFSGVHRLASPLILCKTDRPGQGDGEGDGAGHSRQKRLQRPPCSSACGPSVTRHCAIQGIHARV